MKGTAALKKIDKRKLYYKKNLTEEDAEYAPSLSGLCFYLEPFFGWSRQERFFNIRKIEGGYELEGELYLCDPSSVNERVKELKEELKKDKAIVEYRMVEN